MRTDKITFKGSVETSPLGTFTNVVVARTGVDPKTLTPCNLQSTFTFEGIVKDFTAIKGSLESLGVYRLDRDTAASLRSAGYPFFSPVTATLWKFHGENVDADTIYVQSIPGTHLWQQIFEDEVTGQDGFPDFSAFMGEALYTELNAQ